MRFMTPVLTNRKVLVLKIFCRINEYMLVFCTHIFLVFRNLEEWGKIFGKEMQWIKRHRDIIYVYLYD